MQTAGTLALALALKKSAERVPMMILGIITFLTNLCFGVQENGSFRLTLRIVMPTLYMHTYIMT